MQRLLELMGRTALKVFLSSLVVYAAGWAYVPNLNGLIAVGGAAIVAALAMALKAIQVYIPQLTFEQYVGELYGKLLDAFVHGFLGAFVTAVIGILSLPDMSTWKSALFGAVVGALNTGLKALEIALTPDQSSPRLVGKRTRSSAP